MSIKLASTVAAAVRSEAGVTTPAVLAEASGLLATARDKSARMIPMTVIRRLGFSPSANKANSAASEAVELLKKELASPTTGLTAAQKPHVRQAVTRAEEGQGLLWRTHLGSIRFGSAHDALSRALRAAPETGVAPR